MSTQAKVKLSLGMRSEIEAGGENQKDVRVAVVGCGKMGLLHASLLNTIPGVSVSGLCEKSTRLTRFLKKIANNTRIVNEIEDLSELDLDAVYVTTPIPSHYAIIKNILENRIARNVFTEKTLGADYAQSKELCALIKEKNSVSMVGYHKRFGVTFRKARQIVSDGGVGKTVSFKAFAYSSDFALRPESSGSDERGGALRDLGCHAIDLALWYFEDFDVRPLDTSSKDMVNFAVTTADGISGNISASWRMPDYRMPTVGLSITGTNGRLEVTDDRIVLKRNDGRVEEWYRAALEDNVDFLLGGPEYFREDKHFISSLVLGSNTVSNFESASKVDSIIQRAAM